MTVTVRWWAFGVVDSDVDPPGRSLEGVHPRLAERIRRTHQRHPLFVNSGHRSTELQQQFFECAQTRKKTGSCPPGCERSACASANTPGTSNHEATPAGKARALAVDCVPIDDDWTAFHDVAAEEGLIFPIRGERWHAEPNENPTPGRWDGFPDGW